jgi:uncharacterized protein with FMN-binding domain
MTNERRPSRIPVRGSLVLAVTIGGLALLMGFRSPEGSTGVALAIEPSVDSDTAGASGSEASAPPDPSPSSATSATVEATPSPSASAVVEATTGTRTATGSAFQFRFGVVQVAVTLEGDQIVDVQAVALPDGDRHSAALSQEVEPILRESALAVDSADIDVVSGATYTSLAYAYSLQSALDQLAAG